MGKRGPQRQWAQNMTARFPDGTFERIEVLLDQGEERTAFVRAAVEREIAWRTLRKRRKTK